MGTKAPLPHQLRRKDLFVDRTAQIRVPLPLPGSTVIGRRGSQRDHRHPLHLFHKTFQRFPPLAAQVMSLIQADRLHPGFLHRRQDIELPEVYRLCFFGKNRIRLFVFFLPLIPKFSLVMFHGAVQRLIGDGRDRLHLLQVIGHQFLRRLSFHKKSFCDPGKPLLPDGNAGRQDQTGLPQPPDQLNAKGCLPGTRRRHNMQLAVRQVFSRIGQDPLLIIPPGPLEL